MTLLTAQPPNRLAGCLVKALNVGSREVGRGDLPIVLARAGPPHRAPLAEPDAVSPPRARGDDPGHLAALLRDAELERRAPQQLVGLGAEHRAHVRPRDAHVAVLEHDAQLAHATGRRRAGHLDVRDALQTAAARSEEHTSELQSRLHLVCRLLLEKKNLRRLCRPSAWAGSR